jgi:CRISPR-associated endoribonuclease Cas6
LDLRLYAYRFRFEALDAVCFPPGAASNAFRGAFGHIFRRLACRPDCPGAEVCPQRDLCAYARLFEPAWVGGPSGFADAPRPFVIRAAALDGRRFLPGDDLPVDVHVFDLGEPVLEYLVQSFQQLATAGIGPDRGRVGLASVYALTTSRTAGDCLYEANAYTAASPPPIKLPLTDSARSPVNSVLLRFLTATELKSGGRILADAPFSAVFARARDRIAALCALYGRRQIPLNFHYLDEQAGGVEIRRSDLHWVPARRQSSRTGQVHPLGGFVGEVEYSGDLAPFLPILRAAYWTGIGRQTVWGKGAVEVIPL